MSFRKIKPEEVDESENFEVVLSQRRKLRVKCSSKEEDNSEKRN